MHCVCVCVCACVHVHVRVRVCVCDGFDSVGCHLGGKEGVQCTLLLNPGINRVTPCIVVNIFLFNPCHVIHMYATV